MLSGSSSVQSSEMFEDSHRRLSKFQFTQQTSGVTIASTTSVNISQIFAGFNDTWWREFPNDSVDQSNDSFLFPVVMSVLGSLALAGNLLVLVAFIAFRRMRTGRNLMLANVSVSDIIFVAFTVPTAIFNHVTSGDSVTTSADDSGLVVGFRFCRLVHYIVFVSLYVAIYTLVVASIFRFFGEFFSVDKSSGVEDDPEVDPVVRRGDRTGPLTLCNAAVSCVVIWAAFFASHVNLLLQKNGPGSFQKPIICRHTPSPDDGTFDGSKFRTLWLTFLACAFLLPLTVVSCLSAITLRRQNREPGPRSVKANGNGDCESPYESRQNHSNDRRETGRDLTVLIMAATVARALCWLPVQAFLLIDAFGSLDFGPIYRKTEVLGVCFALAGTCINPLIYHCTLLDFKLAYGRILGRVCCRCHRAKRQRAIAAPASGALRRKPSDMNETIMSIISDSSNRINYC